MDHFNAPDWAAFNSFTISLLPIAFALSKGVSRAYPPTNLDEFLANLIQNLIQYVEIGQIQFNNIHIGLELRHRFMLPGW